MGTKQWRQRVNQMVIRLESAKRAVRIEREALKAAKRKERYSREALKVAQAIAEAIQREAHAHIAGIVTTCLASVFGEEAYEFRLIHEQKRNRTEVRAVFVRDGEEIDPMSEAGGGAVDIAAFGLRIAVLSMKHPQPRRLIVADEPFRFVSVEYRDRVRTMLEMLAKELDFQFIIVTHMPELEVGTVIRL